jgi:hypothetical protein
MGNPFSKKISTPNESDLPEWRRDPKDLSKTCGDIIEYKRNDNNNPGLFNEKCNAQTTRITNLGVCPVDCIEGTWSDWSEDCIPGLPKLDVSGGRFGENEWNYARVRQGDIPGDAEGTKCSIGLEYRICEPVDSHYGPWTQDDPNVNCGPISQSRTFFPAMAGGVQTLEMDGIQRTVDGPPC